jgi:hypothetical protein
MINDYLDLLVDYTGLTINNLLLLTMVIFMFLLVIKKAG